MSIEPRYIEVRVVVRSVDAGAYDRRYVLKRASATVEEEGVRYGGSWSDSRGQHSDGVLSRLALSELARKTSHVRPSWVRPENTLEVVIVGAVPHALLGEGETIGKAIDDALSRRFRVELVA